MPSLETEGGQAVETGPVEGADDINAAFAAAMAGSPDVGDAPPKRPEKPPAAAKSARSRTSRPRAEKSRTTSKTAPAALSDAQRAQGVQGLAQIGAGVFLMLGKASKKDAYVADAVTISSKSEEIADACVQTAKADARFAAALDRVCSAGPYAALISVGVGLVSQIARNHGANIPGTVDPAELLAAQKQAEEAAPAAA